MRREHAPRGLLVAADGAQAAFAAAVVGELARSGCRWRWALGAGLGAQVALLAVLDEAEEAERRWRRQGELGCPLLRSRIQGARERLHEADGVLLLPDALALGGWLDPVELKEFIAPEMAALPERLRRADASCLVAIEELGRGRSVWKDVRESGPREAGELLAASACFPGGWPPWPGGGSAESGSLWGGVAAMPSANLPLAKGIRAWDVVSGFPLPAVERPGCGLSLFELVQRRDEVHGAARVQGWLATPRRAWRVFAPTHEGWADHASREGADLGLEYPLAWERNGELMGLLMDFGRAVARRNPSAVDP